MRYRSVTELSRLIRTKQVSPVELTAAHIERAQTLDPQLFAFVTFTEDLAMDQARAAERRAIKGKLRSPVDGIPWGVKDLFATSGIPTQWGSHIKVRYSTSMPPSCANFASQAPS